MKKLVTLLAILIPIFCSSQSLDSIVIAAIDGIGNTDTVIFGFNEAATVGIDTLLGEKDLYDKPHNDLDLRFIQRTETHIEQETDTFWLSGCYSTGNVRPFPNNLDTKTDFRAPNPHLDNQFVLKVFGLNFPIIIKLTGYYGELYNVPYCIRDSLTITSKSIRDEHPDTIVHIENSQQLCLINFRPWIILSSKKIEETSFKLFPNPANSVINLEYSGSSLLNEVFNSNGTKIETFTTVEIRYELNISQYRPGIYFIRNRFGSYMFIKT